MTLASEWTKLVTLRSTYVILALSVVLGIAITALLAIIVGATWDDWTPAERAEFNPIPFSAIGTAIAGILIVVLGVRTMTSEYSSEMIRVTLMATPRRPRVLAAKLAIVAAVALAAGLVVSVATFVTGQAIFDAYGLESASLGDGDSLRTVLGSAAIAPVFPIIGFALGAVFRSTAGAITFVLALIFAPLILVPLLPGWWQDDVMIYLPGQAGDSIAFAHIDAEDTAYLPLGGAIATLAGWVAVFLAAAHLAFTRRDA